MKLKQKKRKAKAPRQIVAISVPYEVRKQMCEVGNQVNWSEVAVQAFRDKIAAVTNRKD